MRTGTCGQGRLCLMKWRKYGSTNGKGEPRPWRGMNPLRRHTYNKIGELEVGSERERLRG